MPRLTPLFLALACTVTLSSCSNTSILVKQKPSVGQNERVQSLVMHFTAGNYKRSLFALKESGAVSSHYLIPDPNDDSYPSDKLEVIQLVDENKRAWHAGHSYWQGRTNLNDTSIGIEIVNRPDCRQEAVPQNVYFRGGEYGLHMACDFPTYSSEQIALLAELSKAILARHPDISATRVIGHSDIAPARKSDPGPSFPWFELYQQGVGAWYDEGTLDWYLALFQQHQPSLRLVQKALHFYGYKIKQTGIWDEQTANVLYAFQSHFLPKQVTGEVNLQTSATVFSLLDKYNRGLVNALLRQHFREAELFYGKNIEALPSENYQWLSFISGDKDYLLRLSNVGDLQGKQLDIHLDGKKFKSLKVPELINALDLSLDLEEGEHWLEIKSDQNIDQLSISVQVK